MDKVQKSVRKFMELAKQPALDKPGVPDEATRLLGMRLVAEEAFFELAEALGFEIRLGNESGNHGVYSVGQLWFKPSGEPNLVEIADALGDGLYVLLWVANACGIDMEPILAEVCKNNLDKFGPGHSFGPDGKLVKPPGFKGPDIANLLENQKNPCRIVCDLDWKAEKLHRFACCTSYPLVWLWANLNDIESIDECQLYAGDWFTVEHKKFLLAWVTENPSVFAAEFELWYGRKP